MADVKATIELRRGELSCKFDRVLVNGRLDLKRSDLDAINPDCEPYDDRFRYSVSVSYEGRC